MNLRVLKSTGICKYRVDSTGGFDLTMVMYGLIYTRLGGAGLYGRGILCSGLRGRSKLRMWGLGGED